MRRVGVGLARVLFASTALVFPASALGAQATQYTYDALGRVLSAIDANGRKVVYSYDGTGNRTRVSNGAEFQEITPTAWSASSNAGTTGLATAGALKDGDFNALASIHATATETNAWIRADLGSAQTVNHIDVAPAIASAVGATPDDLNDTVVEYSVDGTKWSSGPTINAVSPGASRSVALGGITARYIRIRRALPGQVAVGDFRFFSAAVANSPLIAQPDNIATSGSAVTFDPRANDQDLDGYAFTISGVEDPPHGTAVVNAGASITYTPDPGYFGADSFLYTVADGHNGTASARISALVRPSTNHAPDAVADNFIVSDRVTALVDGLNSLRPTANDLDVDGDVLTITAKTDPSHGTVSIVGGNVIQYVPTVSYTGADSFTYTISDGRGGSDTAAVNVTLANAPPTAGADTVAAQRTTPVTFDPRLNDGDANGDATTVSAIAAAPSKGIATLNGDQTITYRANTGAAGPDAFTYTLTDARGATAAGRVSVAISANTPPTARSDTLSASGTAVGLDPLANDIDPDGDPLMITGITQPSHGGVVINTGGRTVTYTPSPGYTADDSFTYTVSDVEGASATAVVAINGLAVEYLVVAGGGGGGGTGGGGGGGGGVRLGALAAPVGASLAAVVGAGGARGAAQGSGSQGDASSLGSISATGGGGGGRVNAIPSGGSGGSGGGGSAAAGGSSVPGQGYAGGSGSSVASGGGGGADGPGVAGGTTGGGGGRGLDTAFSGTPINYAAGGGAGGYAFVNIGVSVGQGPAGGPSAGAGSQWGSIGDAASNTGGGGGGGSFHREDGNDWDRAAGNGGSGIVIARYFGTPRATGGSISQVDGYTIHTFTSSGSLSVTAGNNAPVAVNDTLATVSGAGAWLDPRANDSDANGDALRISSVGSAVHGSVVVNADAASLIYTANAGYTGSDSFTYTISDGLASATATVNVTVGAGVPLEYLVVAGGGGGTGGGGGGGGVRTGKLWLATSTPVAVTVGAGGVTGAPATNGGDSALGGIVAIGGGAAGAPGKAGGSGGGALTSGSTPMNGGAGTAGQGHRGGGTRYQNAYGGGGGAAGPGGDAGAVKSGDGGPGVKSDISGTIRTYGSGAGGNPTDENGIFTQVFGGNSGAGAAFVGGAAAVPGLGGGGVWTSNGGSGSVIVRYPSGAYTGLGGTITWSGGYTIHTFTSNGTFSTSGGPPPNSSPVAVTDTVSVAYGVAKVITPQANDTDVDGDPLVVTGASTPTHGTVSVASGGASVTYTPNSAYSGSDSFTYTVSDGRGGTATGTVNLTVAAATTPTVWNASRKASSITLSNGDKTYLGTNFGSYNWQYVQAVLGKSSGKWYFEVTFNAIGDGHAVGLGNGSMSVGPLGSGVPGTAFHYGYASSDGNIYNNIDGTSGSTGAAGAAGAGVTIGVAVDLDNDKVWFKRVSVGGANWNNNSSADPASNTGGLNIPAALGGSTVVYPSAGASKADQGTANFGGSSFVGTPPAGFNAGWSS